MKYLMMSVVAAMAMGAMAETANTVKVTKFHQSYPYTGKATVEYTVGGTLPANAVAEFTLNTDNASATFVQPNIVAGANSYTIDFASSFGGAMLLTNASFVVTIAVGEPGGVQLWDGGPYWAECNVGASTPEEYGYYFWWGDTVGYTNTGSAWISVQNGASISFANSGTAASTCVSDLQAAGYVDSTGNLVAAHDAATAHLGSQWRMPTEDEISGLLFSYCDFEFTTSNGVNGVRLTGKGEYANKSIFLPSAGYGSGSDLSDVGVKGYYWSSTLWDLSQVVSYVTYEAYNIWFAGGYANPSRSSRYYGYPVRPVRSPAQ